MLESLGYRVYATGSGQEAVAVYMEKHKEIDLVILDMIMPGLSGDEVFERLRDQSEDPGSFMQRLQHQRPPQKILDRGCVGFMQKPFHLEQSFANGSVRVRRQSRMLTSAILPPRKRGNRIHKGTSGMHPAYRARNALISIVAFRISFVSPPI